MEHVDRIRKLARMSVGRACLFGALGIWAVTFAMITWPYLALKSGAILTTLTGVILIVKALQAPRRSYRRTEVWVLLGKQHGLPEERAQAVISGILGETFWLFSLYAAAIALALWVGTLLVWWLGPGPLR